jgi:aryl-alcohol dehydrogenase-like predicted oxidoreductase
MKAAYDCGVNFFDCAETYAGGESEKVMGEAIKKYGWKRNDLVISTKVRKKNARPAIGTTAFPTEANRIHSLLSQRYTGATPLETSVPTTLGFPGSTSSKAPTWRSSAYS